MFNCGVRGHNRLLKLERLTHVLRSIFQEFMLCRKEEKDPRKCIEEGKMVTACALEFFRKVKKACPQELKDYSQCLDKSSTDMNPKQ